MALAHECRRQVLQGVGGDAVRVADSVVAQRIAAMVSDEVESAKSAFASCGLHSLTLAPS